MVSLVQSRISSENIINFASLCQKKITGLCFESPISHMETCHSHIGNIQEAMSVSKESAENLKTL